MTRNLQVSIVVPVFDEEDSIVELLAEVHAAMDTSGLTYELICIDDGSRDNSFALLCQHAESDPVLRVCRFRRNFGQTAAMQAGLDAANGEVIVLMDADLQNDPADIPRMVQLVREGHDLVAGWRVKRKDAFFSRRLPSILANWLISNTTGVKLHDYGCTLKAMTRDVASNLRLYGEMHRFIPALAAWYGATMLEVEVSHRPRRFGSTKYGIGRTLRVILDLVTVMFLQNYLARPMQVFGLTGLFAGLTGFAICSVLLVEKALYNEALSGRPLLLLGVMLVLVGLQLVSLGLVADVLGRTYHEAQGKTPYHVRTWIEGRAPASMLIAGGRPPCRERRPVAAGGCAEAGPVTPGKHPNDK